MKIGPKDPSLNVPTPGPDDVQKKKTEGQFSVGEGDIETQGPAKAAGPGAKDAVQSTYASFTDKAQLANHLIDSTTGDFKGTIGGSDLQNVSQMIHDQMEEDPYIQNKLDRIMSLAKAR